ncbi:MAG: CpsB/CapC family capsule biosynthesis tyrosine phosphatase [Lachnospiraceae bacterium]
MEKQHFTGSIDMHCHILPHLDDGADNLMETLQMLRQAAEQGIEAIIATPHFHPQACENTPQKIQQRLEEVQTAAAGIEGAPALYLGEELYYHLEVVERLENHDILTLAGSCYVLIEFPLDVSPNQIREAIQNLLMGGYRPIIAHVERYACLRKDIKMLQELYEMGARIQVNADSLLQGTLGTRRFVKKVIDSELLHFMATDAHGAKYRPICLAKAWKALQHRKNRKYAQKILIENPGSILNNEDI